MSLAIGSRPSSEGVTSGAHRGSLVRGRGVRMALIVAANAVGAFAFLWPFALPALASAAGEDHAHDGPWVLLALAAILLAVLFREMGRGGLGPKTVALIGVLGATMVALRLPGFVAGFSAMGQETSDSLR